MKTLLLRLSGPMQSWGTQSRFSHRDAGLEPSKSGIVGLLGAALGIRRDDVAAIKRLSALVMAVRVDKEGILQRDYHTAMDVRKADGKMPPKGQATLSERYFLANAEFLVGLAGDAALLAECDAALRNPVWPVFLGRKSFVPAAPVAVGAKLGDGLVDSALIEALTKGVTSPRRFVFDIPFRPDNFGHEIRRDVPISFAERRFAVRHVRTEFLPKEATS